MLINTPMHIGQELRERREALALSVLDVSKAIHIKSEFITAIETMDTARMPSIGYVLGYIRTYATYMEMNGAEAVARFKTERELPSNLNIKGSPHFVLPKPSLRLPRGTVPALGVIGTVVMLGVWYGGNTSLEAAEPAQAIVNTVDASSGVARRAGPTRRTPSRYAFPGRRRIR